MIGGNKDMNMMGGENKMDKMGDNKMKGMEHSNTDKK
jgi:hypothetical protein